MNNPAARAITDLLGLGEAYGMTENDIINHIRTLQAFELRDLQRNIRTLNGLVIGRRAEIVRRKIE